MAELCLRQHAAFMVLLKTEPRFDYLRSDPHFQDILRRMNFPTIARRRDRILGCTSN